MLCHPESKQGKVIRKYMELYKNPPLRVVASSTGIQMTRVFRLMNGSEMKLSEYEVFESLIQRFYKSDSFTTTLTDLASECLVGLSPQSIEEIAGLMKRKLQLQGLKIKF